LAVSCKQYGVQLWDLRAIRAELRGMRLDWKAAEYPPAAKPARLVVRVLEQATDNPAAE